MPFVLILLAPVVTLVVGAVAAMVARIQGGSRGVLSYVLGPFVGLMTACALMGGPFGAVAGLAAVAFATGAHFGGFTARPLLARLRLMEPAVPYANWS